MGESDDMLRRHRKECEDDDAQKRCPVLMDVADCALLAIGGKLRLVTAKIGQDRPVVRSSAAPLVDK